jgi:uncharacterized protein
MTQVYKETQFDFDAIRKAIQESPEDSSIYIGADSKQYTREGVHHVAYVTVIILHYGSAHGATIFRSLRLDRDYGNLRSRLMTEVGDAIAAGYEIVDHIGNRGFEIHLDINRDLRYKSSALVKEATGYVLGSLGITPKLKPEAFAASAVADRYAVKNARYRRDTPAEKRKFARMKKVGK